MKKIEPWVAVIHMIVFGFLGLFLGAYLGAPMGGMICGVLVAGIACIIFAINNINSK